ncbi:hypothetical protein CJU89_4827 [Yarrowia sp. B02]|nr:hypothetical protein CJU89_4827 [Yarrowia sp. B02]
MLAHPTNASIHPPSPSSWASLQLLLTSSLSAQHQTQNHHHHHTHCHLHHVTTAAMIPARTTTNSSPTRSSTVVALITLPPSLKHKTSLLP